ncbi:DUF2807 domain-containing protein [Sphingobium sp. SCG-1]|uniref:head GIN domain-containing protein n=1 Tax=Sphingobium sp. SCG-1 TaxID=2072936 RepID=UPI000CD69EA7|nr:head GIN domain-containing protein [Sphingobium sp. SCG-1]AUW57209.1 DUF2807 domain-containing protein [Sphingobium sp. SCG-1]
MSRSLLMSLALPLLLASLAGCSVNIKGDDGIENGVAATSDLSGFKNFSGIESAGPDNVIVTVGPAFKVTAEGDSKVLERIEIGVDGGTLKIGRKKGLNTLWSVSDKGATIRVAMPAIEKAALTGSGDMRIGTAKGPRLTLSLTGSGDLTLGGGTLENLKADLTGSGAMRLAGAAREVELAATGSGDIDASALKAGGGSIDVLGSGDVSLNSGGAVSIDIMGSGNATVRGGAKCKLSVIGSGEANCSD